MKRLRVSAVWRMALCMGLLSMASALVAQCIGLFPDLTSQAMKGRLAFCETVAINCSIYAQRNDVEGLTNNLRAAAMRNPEVLSVAIRRTNGELLASVGRHGEHWSQSDGKSTTDNINVPIVAGDAAWGSVELAFTPLVGNGFSAWVHSPFGRFVLFVTGLNGLMFIFYLRRVLSYLDPTRAVPQRVRSALNTLAEGLLVLDENGRIMLANDAFARTIGESTEQLQGREVSMLNWDMSDHALEFPWIEAMQNREPRQGAPMKLQTNQPGDEAVRTFMVNASPILGEDGKSYGVLASFDDVTILERKRTELLRMLEALRKSRDKIRRQNEELQVLATRDPLTGCFNRRSLFEQFENHWASAKRYRHPLSCVMVDIDHFKSINDTHGHSVGDDVLRAVAAALRNAARETDVVGRFGGEEFCVVLPHLDLEASYLAAERFRQIIAALEFPQLKVTASLGVSTIREGLADPQELLDVADKCLYMAKRNGRNRVVSAEQVPDDLVVDEAKTSRVKEAEASSGVPFRAVTALLSALAYRDGDTAAHSARVADYCTLVGRGLMPVKQLYLLEIGALLHDIGKIGVPDSILLKPGPLTAEEWEVMRVHDRIGIEIVGASFDNRELVDIIRCHHVPFAGDPSVIDGPSGEEIPLSARILTIVDAFDAMTSDRVYRKAMPVEAAVAELRRCAGRQFDPALVERFAAVIDVHRVTTETQATAHDRDLALALGGQIERLADAADQHDLETIRALAARLGSTAERYELSELQRQAELLGAMCQPDKDYADLLQATMDLIDLSRSFRSSHVRVSPELAVANDARRRFVNAATTA